MRKVIAQDWMTLDAVVQASGDPEEDTSGGSARALERSARPDAHPGEPLRSEKAGELSLGRLTPRPTNVRPAGSARSVSGSRFCCRPA